MEVIDLVAKRLECATNVPLRFLVDLPKRAEKMVSTTFGLWTNKTLTDEPKFAVEEALDP
jgi:hypothetical protein